MHACILLLFTFSEAWSQTIEYLIAIQIDYHLAAIGLLIRG